MEIQDEINIEIIEKKDTERDGYGNGADDVENGAKPQADGSIDVTDEINANTRVAEDENDQVADSKAFEDVDTVNGDRDNNDEPAYKGYLMDDINVEIVPKSDQPEVEEEQVPESPVPKDIHAAEEDLDDKVADADEKGGDKNIQLEQEILEEDLNEDNNQTNPEEEVVERKPAEVESPLQEGPEPDAEVEQEPAIEPEVAANENVDKEVDDVDGKEENVVDTVEEADNTREESDNEEIDHKNENEHTDEPASNLAVDINGAKEEEKSVDANGEPSTMDPNEESSNVPKVPTTVKAEEECNSAIDGESINKVTSSISKFGAPAKKVCYFS